MFPTPFSSVKDSKALQISNIMLISIDNTLLVLVCFDLIHIFIELEVDVHLFSTDMAPFLLDKELQFLDILYTSKTRASSVFVSQ